MDGAGEAEASRDAGAVGRDTGAGVQGHGLRGADADDVLAAGVNGRVRFGRGPDGVAQDLDDGLRVRVVPAGEVAEAGAAAVDAEGGDGAEGGGEGEEGADDDGGIHGFFGEV